LTTVPISIPSSTSHEADDVRAALLALADNQLAASLIAVVDALGESGDLVAGPAPETLLSPEAAARMLGVSRPFLCKLLDKGVIAEQPRVGTHRKVMLRDIEEYRENRQRGSRIVAQDLSNADRAAEQLIRDLAGVPAKTASKFGY
jgi:excisionase family DNA binding protein